MCIFRDVIQGNPANRPQPIPTQAISQGTWNPYVPHRYQSFGECPCGYLDRFTAYGKAIREAYEDGIVSIIKSLSGYLNIHVVAIGSGELLQEVMWLTKLFSQKITPIHLHLHLVDIDYKEKDSRIERLCTYMKGIIASDMSKLEIIGWNSSEALKMMKIKPHLVIGMDTEHATGSAAAYQWELLTGDVEKTVLVRWLPTNDGSWVFRIYGRKGSDKQLGYKEVTPDKYDKCATSVKNAFIVGV